MRKIEGGQLLFATHNAGKVEEVALLLAGTGVSVVSSRDLALPAPEETETTFLGNARLKAHAAAQASGLPALADDSGLCVDALNGAPGVHTADWAETPQGRDFLIAMQKVHAALLSCGAKEPWRARFHATMVVAWPDGHDEVFVGEVEGQLVWPLRGELGHGYDPMFLPDGETRTFAEMGLAEKNQMSHRSKAFGAFLAGCFT